MPWPPEKKFSFSHTCHDDNKELYTCQWNQTKRSITIDFKDKINFFFEPVHSGIKYPHTIVLFTSGKLAYRYHGSNSRSDNGPSFVHVLNDIHSMNWRDDNMVHSTVGPSVIHIDTLWKSTKCLYHFQGEQMSYEAFAKQHLIVHLEQHHRLEQNEIFALAKKWMHHETAFGVGTNLELLMFDPTRKEAIREWKILNDKIWKNLQL